MILELKKLFGNVFEEDLIQEIAKVGTLKEIPEDFMMIDIGEKIKGVPLMVSGAIKISRENEMGRNYCSTISRRETLVPLPLRGKWERPKAKSGPSLSCLQN